MVALNLKDELDIDIMNDRQSNKTNDVKRGLQIQLPPHNGQGFSPFNGKDYGKESIRSKSVSVTSPKAAFVKFESKNDKKSPRKFLAMNQVAQEQF